MARPTKYSPELSDRICQEIADGKSLRTICSADDVPSMVTVFSWLRTNEEFLKQYEKAKQEQADALVEEMLEIADDGRNDWMDKLDRDGNVVGETLNTDHVQRSRLRLDTRKWIASKLKPKKYGESTQLKHADADGNKLSFAGLFEDLNGRSSGLPEGKI